MTLLTQLEQELARVRKQLGQLTREQTVLTEQITRLRMGTAPELVCAALQVALGVRVDLHLLSQEDGDVEAPAERVPAARRKAPSAVLNGHDRLRPPNTAA